MTEQSRENIEHRVQDRGGWATCSCGFTPRDVSDSRQSFALVEDHIAPGGGSSD